MNSKKTTETTEKMKQKQAESGEDWEGGASRPAEENVPPAVLPQDSPAKNLQRQVDSVPKTNYGTQDGPPKNLQSLPTQDTKTISTEEESAIKIKKHSTEQF